MISKSIALDRAYEFALNLCKDSRYCDPFRHTPEELWVAIDRNFHSEGRDTFCVIRENIIIGLFSFLIIKEDFYLESGMMISKDSDALGEMWDYLVSQYPSWKVDFVYNPGNQFLTALLKQKNASFEVEQMSMRHTGCPSKEKTVKAVVDYGPEFFDEYCNLHSTDVWWTAERVVENPEKFTVFLALDDGQVVGYIDISDGETENMVADLRVAETCWNRGFGRRLLYRALMESGSKPMLLQVNIDNEAAKHLYTSCGFVPVEKENTITAHATLTGNS